MWWNGGSWWKHWFVWLSHDLLIVQQVPDFTPCAVVEEENATRDKSDSYCNVWCSQPSLNLLLLVNLFYIIWLPSITLKLKQRSGLLHMKDGSLHPVFHWGCLCQLSPALCTKFLQIYFPGPSLFFKSFYRNFISLPKNLKIFLEVM